MGSTVLAEPQQKEPGAEREASHDEGDYPTANRLALSPTLGHGTANQFKKSGKNKPAFHRQAPLLYCSALVQPHILTGESFKARRGEHQLRNTMRMQFSALRMLFPSLGQEAAQPCSPPAIPPAAASTQTENHTRTRDSRGLLPKIILYLLPESLGDKFTEKRSCSLSLSRFQPQQVWS